MDPIPLNAVRAAAADVAADTSGTAIAAPVADIAGAAADIVDVVVADAAVDPAVVAADARAAALADAATDTAVVVADVAAAVDLAGDLYRRACCVRRHCGLHVPRSARHFWLWSQRPGHGCRRSRPSSC